MTRIAPTDRFVGRVPEVDDEPGANSARPGRPRRGEIDAAVIAATVELVLEAARPGDVTISSIVERSGSSRAAIYRRWRSREELVAAALDSVRTPVVVRDSGDLLADLLSVYRPTAGVDVTAFDRLLRRRLVLERNPPRPRHAVLIP